MTPIPGVTVIRQLAGQSMGLTSAIALGVIFGIVFIVTVLILNAGDGSRETTALFIFGMFLCTVLLSVFVFFLAYKAHPLPKYLIRVDSSISEENFDLLIKDYTLKPYTDETPDIPASQNLYTATKR